MIKNYFGTLKISSILAKAFAHIEYNNFFHVCLIYVFSGSYIFRRIEYKSYLANEVKCIFP